MAKKKQASPKAPAPEAAPGTAPAEAPPAEPAPPPGPTVRERVIGAVFRPRRLLVLGLVPLAAVLVPFAYRMLPDLARRDAWRLTADALTLTPAPADPVPADLAGRVVRRLARGATGEAGDASDRGPSLLDRGFAERLAGAAAAEPWVAGVVRVETSVPAAATVTVNYRVPAAAVRVRGGLYPVGRGRRVLLPPGDFTRTAAEALPVIDGVPTPPGPAGTAWPDPSVTGAAAIAAALADDWDALRLAAVEPVLPGDWGTPRLPAVFDPTGGGASSRPDTVRFALRTRGGSRIYWGRPPGDGPAGDGPPGDGLPGTRHPGELTAAQKVGRLKTRGVRELLGDEAAGGPVALNITPWDAMYHERL